MKRTSHSIKPTGCNPWALVLALFAIAADPAAAKEKFDPTALAKTIAPFIDDQATVVGRVDFARVAVDPVITNLLQVTGRTEKIQMAKAIASVWTQAFLKAGGREIYLVFTLNPGSPIRQPILYIPLRPGMDAAALSGLLSSSTSEAGRIGDTMAVADTPGDLQWARQIKPDPRPELAAAFAAAGDSAVQLLLLPPKYTQRVIEETMPELPIAIGGGPTSVFTRGVQWAAVGIDLPPRMAIRVMAKSQDAQAAEALRARWVELLRFAGQHEAIRLFVPTFDAIAKLLEPKVDGDRLVLVVRDEDNGAASFLWSRLWAPVIEQGHLGPERTQSAHNLSEIRVAILSFDQGDHERSSPAASYGPDGKPLLSWRVLVLPYLDDDLYKQFHLNEPWDSPHNKTLIAKMPAVYRSPMSKLKEPGRTNYVAPVGPGTVFGGREGMKLSEIKNGPSHTILAVEVADAHAVIWTKPEDLPYDPKDPAKGLGGLYEGGFYAGVWTAEAIFIPLPQPAETLRRMFEAGDGKPAKSP